MQAEVASLRSRRGDRESSSTSSGMSGGSSGGRPSVTAGSMTANAALAAFDAAHTGSFKYNLRFALLFLPSLAIVLAFGGRIAIAVLVTGLMVTYVVDMAESDIWTLTVFWMTITGVGLATLIQGTYLIKISVFYLFLLWTFGMFFVMAGIWGTLQFNYMRQHYLPVCIALERVLFIVFPLPSTVIMTWASLAVLAHGAPFAMVVIQLAHYWVFSLPLTSSFVDSRSSGRRKPIWIVNEVPAGSHALLTSIFPSVLYVALYRSSVFSGRVETEVLVNIALLVVLPILGLRALESQGSLWWLGGHPIGSVPTVVNVVTVPLLLVLVGCFEYRVIFTAFSHYIMVPPPLNYIVVTVALYAVFLIVGMHLNGSLVKLGKVPVTLILLAGAVAASTAVSAPVWLWPFPLLAAVSLVQFYFERNLAAYVAFVSAVCVSAAWFVRRTTQGVEYTFAVGHLRVNTVNNLILVLFAFSLYVPGLVYHARHTTATGLFLLAHTVGLTFLEHALSLEGEGELYPPWLLFATSVVGLALVYRLWETGRINQSLARLTACLYGAKLVIAFEDEHVLAVPVATVWLATVSFNLAAVGGGSLWGSSSTSSSTSPLSSSRGVEKMSRRRGLVAASMIMKASTLTVPFLLPDVAASFLTYTPSLSGLGGLSLVLAGLGCLPLTHYHFKGDNTARRANILLIAGGLIFVLLEPSLSVSAVASSFLSALSAPSALTHSGGAAALWPPWALAIAAFMGLATLLGLSPLSSATSSNVFARVSWPIAMGVSFGFGITGLYLPPSPLLLWIVSLPLALTIVFASSVALPRARTTLYMPVVFSLLVALLPASWPLLDVAFVGRSAVLVAESIALGKVAVVTLYTCIFAFIAFFVKLKLTSASGSLASSSASRTRRVVSESSKGSLEFDWLPRLGNFAVMLSYGLCLFILVVLTPGSTDVGFLLPAPLLLLLNKDSFLFSRLNDQNRYFPMLATEAVVLAISTFATVGRGLVLGASLYSALRAGALALLALPSSYLFLRYAYTGEKVSTLSVLVSFPLAILPTLFASLWATRLLGAFGFASGLYTYFSVQYTTRSAQEFI